MRAASLVQGLPSLRSVPLFPLLCWLGGGGWLALLAPPAVFFGALCNVLDPAVIGWCAQHQLCHVSEGRDDPIS